MLFNYLLLTLLLCACAQAQVDGNIRDWYKKGKIPNTVQIKQPEELKTVATTTSKAPHLDSFDAKSLSLMVKVGLSGIGVVMSSVFLAKAFQRERHVHNTVMRASMKND